MHYFQKTFFFGLPFTLVLLSRSFLTTWMKEWFFMNFCSSETIGLKLTVTNMFFQPTFLILGWQTRCNFSLKDFISSSRLKLLFWTLLRTNPINHKVSRPFFWNSKGNDFGLTCANFTAQFLFNARTRCRIFDSTIPVHSTLAFTAAKSSTLSKKVELFESKVCHPSWFFQQSLIPITNLCMSLLVGRVTLKVVFFRRFAGVIIDTTCFLSQYQRLLRYSITTVVTCFTSCIKINGAALGWNW